MVMNPSDVQRGFSGRPIASAKNNTVRMLTSMRRKFLERFLGRGEEEKSQQEKEEVEEERLTATIPFSADLNFPAPFARSPH